MEDRRFSEEQNEWHGRLKESGFFLEQRLDNFRNSKAKKFNELQKKWYRKLKDSGFDDIEVLTNTGMRLKNEHRRFFRTRGKRDRDMYQSTFIQAKITYYLNLTQKVHDPKIKFKREIDRIVMTMHSDGFNRSEIVKFLAAFGYKRRRKSIVYLIRRYEDEWGLKRYSQKQLNKRPKKTKKAQIMSRAQAMT